MIFQNETKYTYPREILLVLYHYKLFGLYHCFSIIFPILLFGDSRTIWTSNPSVWFDLKCTVSNLVPSPGSDMVMKPENNPSYIALSILVHWLSILIGAMFSVCSTKTVLLMQQHG